MTAVGGGDAERDLVPRWRSIERTVEAGEFQRLSVPRELSGSHIAELRDFEERWHLEPNLITAAEFIGAAVVAGERLPTGDAERLLDSDRILPQLRTHTRGGRVGGELISPVTSIEPQRHLSLLKASLARDPRNAITWAAMARRYTSLAQFEQADRALRVARALAPSSRYLLRVSARFLVHVGRPDEAFRLLEHSPRTRSDPWLMAAMLASASIASLPVTELKRARRMLADDSFRLIERSELESELATLDLRTGSDKKARKAFQRSLVEPTDNALAQAQWASKSLQSLEFSPQLTEVPFNAEARTRAATGAGRWPEAVDQAVKWLDDQPFDTDAAVLGSYAASLGLNDWSSAIAIARSGLTAQPAHPILLNNLAYALVEDGEFAAASDVLGRIPEDSVGRVPPTATRGLLAFRTGSVQLGRALYSEAIAAAAKLGDRSLEAMARAMLLREELKVGELQTSSEMAAALQRIAGGLSKEPGVATVLARVADELARATRSASSD